MTGNAAAVHVEARNSSIDEVLKALRATLQLQYRSSANLDRPVTGTFKGPLLQVIASLLSGYDYVVKVSAGHRIEVIIVNPKGGDANRVIARPPMPMTPMPRRPRTGP